MHKKKVTIEDFKAEIFKHYGKRSDAHKHRILGGAVGYLLLNNMLTDKDLRGMNKHITLEAIRALSDIKMHTIGVDAINDFFYSKDNRSLYSYGSLRQFRLMFVKMIITPLSTKKILLHSNREWIVQTLEKYKIGVYSEYKRDVIVHSMCGYLLKAGAEKDTRAHKKGLRNMFQDVYLKKWDELSEHDTSHLGNLIKTDKASQFKTNFYAILDHAKEQGVHIPDEVYSILPCKVGKTDIDFDRDTWVIKEQNRTSTLYFEDYEFDKKIKNLLKKWVLHRYESNLSGHKRSLSAVDKILIDFLCEKDMKLKKLNRITKAQWVDWIKEKVESNQKGFAKKTFISHFKAVTGFIRYLLEFHPKEVSVSIATVLDLKLYPRENSKQGMYSDYEIEILTKAIRRDSDEYVKHFLILSMLTAKRSEELLTLKKDCIVYIDKYAYLKYTCHKTREVKKFPIFGSSLASHDLFTIDTQEIILDIVSELNSNRETIKHLASKSEEDYLFIEKRMSRNQYGNLASLISYERLHERLNDFQTRNGLRFKVLPHKFRHTLTSRGLRGGLDVKEISMLLGNTPATVYKYYDADITKEETLGLDVSTVVDPLEAVKEFSQEEKIPEVTEKGSYKAVVPGGYCKCGEKAMMSCKYYASLFGSGSCLSCPFLAVSKDNLEFYELLEVQVEEEYEAYKNTPFHISSINKLSLIQSTILHIEEYEGGQEW